MSSEHSSSSSELKSSNGSTRSDKKNENKSKSTFVKAATNKNSANSNAKLVKVLVQKQSEKKKNATVKKIHLLPPSVQKAPRQVPNSHHAKSHQKVPPSPHDSWKILRTQTSLDSEMCCLNAGCRDPCSQFQDEGFMTKATRKVILSRGRTWESREISAEKLAVLGKGADPTEEEQWKKDFWHFRCHKSRALPIEENLHRIPSRLLNSSICKTSSPKNTHSTSISLTSEFVLPYFVYEICA
ncbi:hypothetical protein Taro_007041 [Colocasia esculenta]|uniref:Uncharacterized protein n=1 Tax=Colocasia esculenta TaxID=4460 RepID=A0A843TX08_COLES|nr:hypothetical protein [Colocasia esculenta]